MGREEGGGSGRVSLADSLFRRLGKEGEGRGDRKENKAICNDYPLIGKSSRILQTQRTNCERRSVSV